jgi:serine/threonine-protein kinase
MTDSPLHSPARLIDRLCDEFEATWRKGLRPDLEDFLARAPESGLSTLFRELLVLELEYRVQRGESPTAQEYVSRFPVFAAVIDEIFTKTQSEATSLPGVLLFAVTEGPHKGRSFRFEGHETFLVGRSKLAHFQLPTADKFFSRIHFMVEANPPQCRLTDMGSHNGTYVNGKRVISAPLHDGDHIRAGHTTLQVSFTGTAWEKNKQSPNAPDREKEASVTDEAVSPPPTVSEAAQIPTPNTTISFESQALPDAGISPSGPADAQDPPPRLAGYRILREIGRGRTGVVYLVERERDGSRAALKTLVPSVAASPVQLERFLREARILCELEHPNIVSFNEMGESDGQLFFAMEYVEGTDARKMLKEQGPLPVRQALEIISEVLFALEYAHTKGFVHRDLKPSNILLAKTPNRAIVKVADFGLARVYQASQLSGLSLEGTAGGTLAFMPPEQITHFRDAKPPADQYSIGATLYNLLTGEYIHDFTGSSTQAITKILQGNPVPIQERRPDLPAGLCKAIHKSLARQPARRFRSAREMRRALLPFAASRAGP